MYGKRNRYSLNYFNGYYKMPRNNKFMDRWGFNWRASQRSRINASFKLIKPVLRGKGKILEVGCASGDFLIRMIKDLVNFDIVGIDVSYGAIETCKRRFFNLNDVNKKERGGGNNKLTLELGELPNLKYTNGEFRLIICMEVLAYFNNEGKKLCIKEIKRVLSKDGFVLLSTNLSNNNNENEKKFLSLVSKEFEIVKVEYTYNKLYYRYVENRILGFCMNCYVDKLCIKNNFYCRLFYLLGFGKLSYRVLSSMSILRIFEKINKKLWKNGKTHILILAKNK